MSHASPLKTAFFSALLVLAVAYPVLGLKLTTVGIKLEVHGASPAMLWTIAGAAVLMFVWQLLRNRLDGVWAKLPELPKVPGAASNFLTLPSTQRWIILALVMIGLVWPFFASRGSVDIYVLDSDAVHVSSGSTYPLIAQQRTWLAARLAERTAPWRIAVFHQSPTTSLRRNRHPWMNWPELHQVDAMCLHQ